MQKVRRNRIEALTKKKGEKMTWEKKQAEEAAKLELEAEEQARIADKAHCAQIEFDIFEDLFNITQNDLIADKIVEAIKTGDIENVTINY